MTWSKRHFSLVLLFPLLQGCGIYSFSGTSLPPEAKTFSLRVQSDISLGPPDLAMRLQQQLGDALVQRTTLKQVNTQEGLQLEGSIKRFAYTSIAPTQSGRGGKGYQAAMERLTIEVQLNYTNPYNQDTSFSKKMFV